MTTNKARAADGVELAYDVTGTGPAVILLHGGGQSRRAWHDAGYVSRLRDQFTVIAMDIRGNGESGRPRDADSYAIGRLTDDVIAVADDSGVDTFAVWGFSYGGNIGRYLPARSPRVQALVIVGIGFGSAAPARFRDHGLAVRDKWTPIIDADRRGLVDVASMSDQDRALWETGNIPVIVAQLSAILNWPPVEPGDLPCPTLWVVGSANTDAMESVHLYGPRLAGTNVALHVVAGLTHADELTRVDEVLTPMVQFTRRQSF